MDEEIDAMMRHKVWEVVPRPKDKRVIKCKWVYNIKENPTAKRKRYKAYLVVMGGLRTMPWIPLFRNVLTGDMIRNDENVI